MARSRPPLPVMDSVGYRSPDFSHESKAGRSYSVYYCEGCGASKTIPDDVMSDSGPPMFFGHGKDGDGCGCTRRRELTQYSDPCQKCSGPIFLTPGHAMYRKREGAAYVQRKEYCDACLSAIVFKGPCRNVGCASVGGSGQVQATFGEQLFYERKGYTFPPNNCAVCRATVKAFKRRQEVRPTCTLCRKAFSVSYGFMIMLLKNEPKCEIPKLCVRCRALSPDDRRRLEEDGHLAMLRRERRNEIAKLFGGDKHALERERSRRIEEIREKKQNVRDLLATLIILSPRDVRDVLHRAQKDGVLVSMLSNPKHPDYRTLQDALVRALGGRSTMTQKEFTALPSAARLVLEKYPNAKGLFDAVPKHRGKGSSPLHQHYELLSAAALMTHSAKSKSGKTLFIDSLRDKVDFGVKFPRETGIFDVKSKTIEADTLVHRPGSWIPPTPPRDIAIDAKHTTKLTYTHVPHEQLKGIRQGFNLGKFHEFYFVTNKAFGADFIAEVRSTNVLLVRDFIEAGNRQAPPELGPLDKFHEAYRPAIERFVSVNNIEQIEMCEYVAFPGT